MEKLVAKTVSATVKHCLSMIYKTNKIIYIQVKQEQKYSSEFFVFKVSTGLENDVLRGREEFSTLFLFDLYCKYLAHRTDFRTYPAIISVC